MRLRSVELSESEWLRVEEAAILSALRT